MKSFSGPTTEIKKKLIYVEISDQKAKTLLS